jgi:hypothetical protein
MAERQASVVEEITLPSGMVVDARRPPLAEWIKRGQLPSGLMKLALDAFGDGKGGLDPQQAMNAARASAQPGAKPEIDPATLAGMKPEDFTELMVFTGHVVQQTVISPRIVVQVDGMAVAPDQPAGGPTVYVKARGVATGRHVVQGTAGWQETLASGVANALPLVRPIDEDEEIDAAEISNEDTTFIFNYAMTGSTEGKVEMAGGEMSAAEAASFRPTDTFPSSGEGSTLLEGPAVDAVGG